MSQAKAAECKAEGNALFAKKKYALAYAKYTDAIAEDGSNAILYANRAACSLSMCKWVTCCVQVVNRGVLTRPSIFRFLDAATDAKQV